MFAIREGPLKGNVRDLLLEGRGVSEGWANYVANLCPSRLSRTLRRATSEVSQIVLIRESWN
jgi:hypothetical protein